MRPRVYVPLDTWWTVRFLFPAFPILFVFVSVAIIALTAKLQRHVRWLTVLTLLVLVTIWVMKFG